jgi:hypothetical protein
MLGYDFEIIYRKGKQNFMAYALSRKDEDVQALNCDVSILQPKWIVEARDEWKNDEECGYSFISYNKTPVHLIPLAGKLTLYGTRITYIYVITPN